MYGSDTIGVRGDTMSQLQPKTGGADSTAASDVRQTPAGEADRSPDETARDDDELFDILANQRRRFALHYLRQRPDDTVSLTELSEQVAGWEHDVDPAELDYRKRKSVRNSLHQFHLPKLDDAGIVAYDDQSSEVSLLDAAGANAYHDVVDDDGVPWTAYLVGASVGALAVSLLTAFEALAGVSSTVWAIVFGGAFVLATTAYAYRRSKCDTDGPPPECRS